MLSEIQLYLPKFLRRTWFVALLVVLGFGADVHAAALSDTTIVAATCANQPYNFNGTLLTASGIYTDTLTATSGADSVVTLDLTVLPVFETEISATICAGENYVFNGDTLNQTGAYVALLKAVNGCDSTVTLKLTVADPVKTEFSQGICAGSSYVFNGETLTETGTYIAVLTGANGCDSTVVLNLEVVPFFDVQLQAAICPDETIAFGDTTLGSAGVYVDSLVATGGCDSIVTLTLTVLPMPVTALNVSICDGSGYVFFGDTLTTGGLYARILPGAAANGCDSVVTLTLTTVPFFDVQLEASICANETFSFGGELLDDAGIYTDTLQAVGGCDSILTLTLTVLPVAAGTDTASICDGDTLVYAGEALTTAGNYDFVLQAANGCDSTVTLTLNVLPTSRTEFEAVSCAGELIVFEGDTITASGTYSYVYPGVNGCDSIITLNIEVLDPITSALPVAICAGQSFVYEGDTLTTAGDYPYVFIAESGCDSTVTLTLTVNQPTTSVVAEAICAGASYVFHGDTLTAAGTYTAVLVNADGCDSTVTLTLEVLSVQAVTINETICANGVYVFQGDTLTAAGTYNAVLTGTNGCDSTVTLELDVLPTTASSFDTTVCSNQPLAYGGQLLTESGAYDFTFTGENGCDSTVTINLTVLPVPSTIVLAAICPGESYVYDGDTLTTPGDYPYTYTAANGCDSLVTVTLNVLPTAQTDLSLTLCFGESFVFDGDTLTTDGTYTAVLSGANGCDSTVTLALTFVPAYSIALEATICDGETYSFGGVLLTESGVYTDSLTAVAGCDSTVILTLTVLPISESTSATTICAGDTLFFNGGIITETGFYIAQLTGVNGCDSLAGILVDVLPAIATSIEASICPGAGYAFNGAVLTDPGTYAVVLPSASGCDSTVTLTLTVLSTASSTLPATICAGENFVYEGDTLSTAGSYPFVLQGSNGCDSTVTVALNVLPVAAGSFTAAICPGTAFEYAGASYTDAGTYEIVFAGAAANGCDSVVTLELSVLPAIPSTQASASICNGDTLDFYGVFLTEAGIYTAYLEAANGCDSTIVLTLSVLQPSNAMIVAQLCPGGSYLFNGETLTEAGTYTAVLTAANGCDSIVTLVLSVLDLDLDVTLFEETLSATATPGAVFEWIDCDDNTVVGTAATFTATETGNYAVIVTDPLTGCGDTSACFFVEIVNVRTPLANWTWSLQPNPAGAFTAAVLETALTRDVQLELYDAAGRRLHSETVPAGTTRIDLDLANMPDGVLTVRLIGEEGVSVRRLVKGE